VSRAQDGFGVLAMQDANESTVRIGDHDRCHRPVAHAGGEAFEIVVGPGGRQAPLHDVLDGCRAAGDELIQRRLRAIESQTSVFGDVRDGLRVPTQEVEKGVAPHDALELLETRAGDLHFALPPGPADRGHQRQRRVRRHR
jgi:hypothetical protein